MSDSDPTFPPASASRRWRLVAAGAIAVLLVAIVVAVVVRGGSDDRPPDEETGEPAPQTTTSSTTTSTTTVPEFPDADSTGVPDGIELEPSESLDITEDGAVVDSLHVTGSVQVRADDVTIRNSRITGTSHYPVRVMDDATGLVIEDTEIEGTSDRCAAAIAFGHYTARRVDVHGCADGLKVGANVVVEDSYIHDLRTSDGSHNDVIQSSCGSDIVIRGNRLVWVHSQNAVVFLKSDNCPIEDVVVEDNYLDGGGYTVYSHDGGHGEPTDVIFRGNHIGRSYVHDVRSIHGEVEWTGNRWADTLTEAR